MGFLPNISAFKTNYLQNFEHGKEGRVQKGPNGTTVYTGGGNDTVSVTKNAGNSVTISINGEKEHFTEEEAKNLSLIHI